MRIIKVRYLSGVVVDLKDSMESLKWLITNKAYLSNFYYENTKTIEEKLMDDYVYNYLQATRPILVPPTNTLETQTITKSLSKISNIHFKYVMYSETGRIERYAECLQEAYPRIYGSSVEDYRDPDRNQRRLADYIETIKTWIYEKQGQGFTVTWHQE